MSESLIFSTLKTTGLPCCYSHFRGEEGNKQEPPYIVYIGNGQNVLNADNTHYWRENRYQVEYYFKLKNEANEASIEDALLNAGFIYEKSEDNYIEEQNVFVIYYYI